MRKSLLTLGLFASLTGPVLAAPAQSLPDFGREVTANAAAPATPAASLAPSTADDAAAKAQLELARTHFDLLHMGDRLAELMSDRFSAIATLQASSLGPGAGPAAVDAMQVAAAAAVDAGLADKAGAWKEAVAAILARTYTAAELTALNRFYETDTGKTIAAKGVELNAALREAAPAMLPPADDLAADILRRFCAKTGCRT